MSKLKGNLVVAQPGGPTAVINNTVRGVVEEALKHGDTVETIYGAKEGVLGLLEGRFYNMSTQPAEVITGLTTTPSSALGSARKKIGESELGTICQVLKEYNIHYVFFIGGNDSQDTAHKLSMIADSENYELRVIGLPKTIDNDLTNTDHTPGFGIAGRYAAVTTMDLDSELRALQSITPVSILETFGQKHGWLPSMAYLAKQHPEDGPHLVYIPEFPINIEQILEDVQNCYDRAGRVMMVISEGLKDETGQPIGVFAIGVDGGFDAKMYGGAAAKLRNIIFKELGLAARYCLPSAALQCSLLCQSQTDRDEAYEVGAEGVRQAIVHEQSGYMVAIKRLSDDPYRWTTELVKLEKVATSGQIGCCPRNLQQCEWIEFMEILMQKSLQSIVFFVTLLGSLIFPAYSQAAGLQDALQWSELPQLPDDLGRAGVFTGVHNDALIVAGGANFPQPVWETSKVWHDDVYVLTKEQSPVSESWKWHEGFKLKRPLAYGAAVSTEHGVVCIGGNDAENTYTDVFLLRWNPETKNVDSQPLPALPAPCAYASAACIGDIIYLAGGTSGPELETATTSFLALDMSKRDDPKAFDWRPLPSWPGPSRAFNITVAQHNGKTDCIYVISGRRAAEQTDGNSEVRFLRDVYEFSPSLYDPQKYSSKTDTYDDPVSPWRKRADVPQCVMAGTAAKIGQSHIFVLSGADGAMWGKADELKDDHPGFPKKAFAYHTITDTWTDAGDTPANHVTTSAVRWGDDSVNDPIIIPSGEVRPRVRSPKIWRILPLKSDEHFGVLDFSTIGLYLALMIGVGVFFSFRNKNTDDFFRGGQRVPWFVAGMSIFATMLSSITFIAIPAKAFATDWVYFIANMTAVLVAPLVIWMFLPFFRKIDATSAYEYLEKRFNHFVRLFASASFILFQIGRMAVVMYLPALALAAITPMTEIQCILLMGALSIIYCTMGGLEAVVWTDTIQSFVLLGGALLSLLLIVSRVDGNIGGFIETATTQSKFHMVNWDFSSVSFATTALWVVLLGGIGQSLVPYSSDMAVVQRYMSVPDIKQARRAIWTNAVAVIPASLLFFGVGTALFVFYAHNPGRLDPTFKNDAIFPLFIARELPAGLAGLVIAGVFAAAQSTISTSMNSTSTAFITDFIRPLNLVRSERNYLRLARTMTLVLGCLGTAMAVMFAASDIKSLWDQFMKILGLFGGSMCGLFCLGIFTTRTTGFGAIIGAFCGAVGLFCIQMFTGLHLLLYATVGIVICFVTGYAASLIGPSSAKSTKGLTLYTINQEE